jgi:hypothetical protein
MLKALLFVLLCIALAIMIRFLGENPGPNEAGRANILGYESDSTGGRYIYLSNGDVYHRSADKDPNGNKTSLDAYSSQNQGYIQNQATGESSE